MLEQRDLKTDVLALAVVAATIFLGAALLTYDPGDPPSKLVYPERVVVLNACGHSGALVAATLFSAVGAGGYYLLVSMGALAGVLLARHKVDDPGLRVVGWLISLVGLTAVIAMAAPQFSPGPVIGSGGYLGAMCRSLLETHFANTGAYILAGALVAGGLFLCTDYVILRATIWLVQRTLAGLGHGAVGVLRAYAQKLRVPEVVKPERKRRSDLGEPTVKLPARPVAVEETRSEMVVNEKPEAEKAVAEAAASAAEAETQKPETTSKQKSLASRLLAKLRGGPKEEMIKQLDRVSQLDGTALSEDETEYELPSIEMLLTSEPIEFDAQEQDVRRKAKILEKTFADFGFNIRVVEIQTGPVIAQFEVELEAGLRLSRITGLADDLAIALRVPSVRIVAPIPGKNTVGIEVPNNERQLVRMREVMEEAGDKSRKMRIPLYLGKDVAGAPMVVDLSTLPHLLIAGRTGTGKSVCLNTIIVSILMTRRPDEVRMLMIDPKMVELSPYKSLPHLMHPVVTDMKKAEAILGWAVEKMEERYALLARAGVRHLSAYNQLGEEELLERIRPENDEERKEIPLSMPYIVIVADEIADLMMTSAKEVETHIIRLAQKSRAVGIHLVLATQKPTVDVITGLIKSNLPARISFQVASRTDSRVVLDEMGAERLLGNGDLLFLWPGTSTILRGQGTYLSDDEINQVIASVATTEPQFVTELVQLQPDEPQPAGAPPVNSRDDLYEAAIDVVVREGRGSVSLLQRALGIGYGRAARLVDYMAEDGIVGNYNGSQARDVLLSVADWEARQQSSGSAPALAPSKTPLAAPRRPSNTIVLGSAAAEAAEPPFESDDDEETTSAKPVARSESKSRSAVPVASDEDEEDDEDYEDEDEVDEADEDEEEDLDADDEDPPERGRSGRWSATA